MSTVVFVSGFTSYIALHIVKKLLAKNYKVVGSGRSHEKCQQYTDIINNPLFSFVVVPELSADNAFDDVFQQHQDIKFVVHVASPLVPIIEDPEKEALIPAINGTTSVLKAAHKYGPHVKRVVITSSYVAHCAPSDHYGGSDLVITEESWSSITYEQSLQPNIAYWGSKKFAEKAAWDFLENEKPQFSLATYAPTLVFGPQAYDEVAKQGPVSTLGIISSVLKKDYSAEKMLFGDFSDVRDVSEGHIRAFELESAAGHRFLLGNGRVSVGRIVEIVRKHFPELELPATEVIPDDKLGVASTNCEETLTVLGQKDLISLEQGVVDSVKQMLDVGVY
ncbi:NADPH-dependent methylglyoxal reductase Gre2 [Yamadazyma tenuis]|uniref:NADPH-dependent methylglyoxal reductase GRE2 n=1 Tax=Candida tenuis (strain ATCC 10573 / BCRC 21748 / CBS 615 / JCM 9827 / NBRC 10315 / NRRL Y-1498 / VKM Y-70) TaxID=590646 RepID=G3BFP0_CANTC|nr:NADPH-dependent methylglyoxal reductase GRE2 [Yamadazyma tenuis ATCC 10573]EGV60065.1 NADPH-dependent methylglyoxal reductase GRE2 [Yamadazyma tenuis ATCC 10573]WEJ94703.1 NADPH-dependent methylglyoxal reductase Gre2 [Yamadazyma tenuis]